MNVRSAMLLLLLTLLTVAACSDDTEEVGPDRTDQPTASSSPGNAPDSLLLETYSELPLPPSATRLGEGNPFSGQVRGGFTGHLTTDEITAFYNEALLPAGWKTELSPEELSYPDKGAGAQSAVRWSYIREDVRLMIQLNLTPKNAEPGEVSAQLILEPVWYPGFEIDATATPPSDTE